MYTILIMYRYIIFKIPIYTNVYGDTADMLKKKFFNKDNLERYIQIFQ